MQRHLKLTRIAGFWVPAAQNLSDNTDAAGTFMFSIYHRSIQLHHLTQVFMLICFCLILSGCAQLSPSADYALPPESDPSRTGAASASATPFDGKNYLQISTLTDAASANASDTDTAPLNSYSTLDVPTSVTKIDGTYFIVDCYHNQIIYHENLSDPLSQWHVMTSEIKTGHTLAGDGTVYLADDTGNNRVLVFEKKGDLFIHTQTFDQIGNKPHALVYDKTTDTFYCWSSFSGEMYLFRHMPGDSRMYLTEIRKIDRLSNVYVRSFTIVDDVIYFVSGLPTDGTAEASPSILCCRLSDFSIIAEYPVPDSIAGMAYLMPIGHYFYLTVSTDLSGSQDAATILRCSSLKDLASGKDTDLYQDYFVGGGTPYFLGEIDGAFYLTEHRLQNHALWQFHVSADDTLTDVTSVY